MDKEYTKLTALIKKIAENDRNLAKDKSMLDEIKKKITENDTVGEYAMTVTSHAFEQISSRLEQVAYESQVAYKDIMDCKSEDSIFIPSNLRSFIIENIAKSRKDSTFERRTARNSGGNEFVYNVALTSWNTDKDLFMSIIVENNVVKTGYFNFVNPSQY